MAGETKTYMLIEEATGKVVNRVEWDGVVWDGTTGWQPDEGFFVVQFEMADIGWTYKDGVFSAPPVPPPTPEEILARNKIDQDSLLARAAQSMAPVLVSLNLGDATDSETLIAKEWQAYYRALKVVDITEPNPEWPAPPESV